MIGALYEVKLDYMKKHKERLSRLKGKKSREEEKDLIAVEKTLLDEIIKDVEKHAPGLCDGRHNDDLNAKKMKAICLSPKDGEFSRFIYRLRVVADIVWVAKKKYGWGSVAVPLAVEMPTEAARCTLYRFQQVAMAMKVKQGVMRAVENIEQLTFDERITLIFLSMISHGALLNKTVMLGLMKMRLSDIQMQKGLMWFDVVANGEMGREGNVIRFFVDPLTRQLIKGLKKDYKEKKELFSEPCLGLGADLGDREMTRRIKSFLASAVVGVDVKPGYLARLLSWFEAHWSLYLPYYLLDYATGRNVSFSLSPVAFQRFLESRASKDADIGETIKRSEEGEECDALNFKEGACCDLEEFIAIHPLEFDCLDQIAAYLRAGDPGTVASYLEEKADVISPTLRLLSEWAVTMITEKSGGKGAECTYSQIAAMLVAYAQGQDISTMESGWVETLYSDVLETAQGDSESKKLSKALCSFHTHLVKHEGTEVIDFKELDGFVVQGARVSANILMPHEYEALLERLWPGKKTDDRLGWIRYLVTVLGYRLGLRRKEVLKLCLSEVTGDALMYIEIKKNYHGRVKSLRSVRILPLYDLLSEEETHWLRVWNKQRSNESTFIGRRMLLFCDTGSPYTMMSEYRIFTRIQNEMRAVTGDESMVFHTLRHSFATWMMMEQEALRIPSIMEAELKATNAKLVDTAPKPVEYEKLYNYTTPSKRVLLQTSFLIGHSTPRITMYHYIHLLCWILHHWVIKYLPMLGRKALQGALGLQKTMAYDVKKMSKGAKNGSEQLARCLQHQRKGKACCA